MYLYFLFVFVKFFYIFKLIHKKRIKKYLFEILFLKKTYNTLKILKKICVVYYLFYCEKILLQSYLVNFLFQHSYCILYI